MGCGIQFPPMPPRQPQDVPDLPIPDETRLREIRERLAEIPPPSVVVRRLLSALSNPKSSAKTVSDLAASDPSLSTSILKAVNVAAHGLSQPVKDIRQAVALLGFIKVRSLVLQFGLSDLMGVKEPRPGYSPSALWAHSLCVSFLAEAIARRTQVADPGFVATLGLLHDIGKLAMNSRFPEKVAWMFGDAPAGKTFLAREVEAFGSTHALIGGELADAWRLPGDLCTGIYYHHSFRQLPANVSTPLRRALRVVQIANQVAKYLHVHGDDVEVDLLPLECFREIGLAPPIEGLVDAEAKSSVTSAILFIEQMIPRPIGSFPKLLRVRATSELPRMGFAGLAQDDSSTSIEVGPCRLLETLRRVMPVELRFDPGQEPSAEPVKGRGDVRFVAPLEAASLEKLSAVFRRHVESLEFGSRNALVLHFLSRAVIGSALRAGAPGAELSLRLRRLPSGALLHFDCPALEFRRVIGPAVRERLAALLARSLGSVVTLEWVDRIETDDTGRNWVFAKEWKK